MAAGPAWELQSYVTVREGGLATRPDDADDPGESHVISLCIHCCLGLNLSAHWD